MSSYILCCWYAFYLAEPGLVDVVNKPDGLTGSTYYAHCCFEVLLQALDFQILGYFIVVLKIANRHPKDEVAGLSRPGVSKV